MHKVVFELSLVLVAIGPGVCSVSAHDIIDELAGILNFAHFDNALLKMVKIN